MSWGVLVIKVEAQSLFPSFGHFCQRHLFNLKCLGGARSLGGVNLCDEIWMIGLGI